MEHTQMTRRRFTQYLAAITASAVVGPAWGQSRPAGQTANGIMDLPLHETDQGTGAQVNGHFVNGECWLDDAGNRIQAHGGGVLIHKGVYYWYGEHRMGPVKQVDGKTVQFAGGVSCYQSTDLINWKYNGVALAASDDPDHDLYGLRVLERPKVIYNEATKKFVLWLHVDKKNYGYARAGVAVSDSPTGPFKYIESFRPNGFMSRDQTIFVDREGRGFHVGSSDENSTGMVSLLTDDYLKPSGKFQKVFAKRFLEAFSFVEHDNRYWTIASGCTGWKPNKAHSGVARDMLGPWEELPNPCVGPNADLTFGGQSAAIIPVGPANKTPIAMFDIWRPKDLKTSGYLWLPIRWQENRMIIDRQPTWPPPGMKKV